MHHRFLHFCILHTLQFFLLFLLCLPTLKDSFAQSELTQEDLQEVVEEKLEGISEYNFSNGLLEFSSGRYETARQHFEDTLKIEPNHFIAMEYLSVCAEKLGELDQAIAWLEKILGITTPQRRGAVYFHLGRLYLLLNQNNLAKKYLEKTIVEGTFLTQAHYGLGFLFYQEQKYEDAEYYFHKAQDLAQRKSATDAEREFIQPCHYYLAIIYTRIGYIDYAVSNLRNTEVGPSWEMRKTAWKIHAELNEVFWQGSIGVFGQYIKTPVLYSLHHQGALDVQTVTFPLASLLFIHNQIRTAPSRRWGAEIENELSFEKFFNDAATLNDQSYGKLVASVTYSDLKKMKLKLGYLGAASIVDSLAFSSFQASHGPTFSYTYYPSERWNWETGLYTLFNDALRGEPSFNGLYYAGYVRGILFSPNPSIRPSIEYSYGADLTAPNEFKLQMHRVMIGARFDLSRRLQFEPGLGVARYSYPSHPIVRKDLRFEGKGVFSIFLGKDWYFLLKGFYEKNNSTGAGGITYASIRGAGGVLYTF